MIQFKKFRLQKYWLRRKKQHKKPVFIAYPIQL